MNRLKLALIAIGFILLSITQLEAKDTNKLSTSDCEITFGWDVVKPYQYWNNGKVVGFQIERFRFQILLDTVFIPSKFWNWDRDYN